MAYTTDDIILWGKISQPYALRGELKKQATEGETMDVDLHTKLYIERKTVEWYNSQDTVDEDILYTISNFLFALEGIYGLIAQFVDGGSGGIVAPTTTASTTLPDPIDWAVGTTTSGAAPLADGESSVTLNGTNGMPNLRGYNIEFSRGAQVQVTTQSSISYYTWNRTTGVFTCTPAAVLDENFRILPTR